MIQQADILPSSSGVNASSGMVMENSVTTSHMRKAHCMDCHYEGEEHPTVVRERGEAVSYTHLTLPTILLV